MTVDFVAKVSKDLVVLRFDLRLPSQVVFNVQLAEGGEGVEVGVVLAALTPGAEEVSVRLDGLGKRTDCARASAVASGAGAGEALLSSANSASLVALAMVLIVGIDGQDVSK